MSTATAVRANRFAAACITCGGRVEAEAGTLTRGEGRWEVRHQDGQCQEAPAAAAAEASEPVGPGVYRRDGQLYVVKLNQRKTHCYAKRLVQLTTHQHRLTEGGDVVHYEFEYAPGALRYLTEADRVPADDAQIRDLMVRYGRCLCCGRTLKAANSVGRMVGPVCIKYFALAA